MKLRAMALLPLLLFLNGCAYYEITDPTSGRTYITDNWHMNDQRWMGGGLTFTDIHSGDLVTLQNTDIKRISQNRAQIDEQGGAPPAPPPYP